MEIVLVNVEFGFDCELFEMCYKDMKIKLVNVKEKVEIRYLEIDEKVFVLYKYYDKIEDFVVWLIELERKLLLLL